MKMLISIIMASFLLTGCTYYMTMVQTKGQADDVVDEAITTSPNTSIVPTISIPASNL